MSLIQQQLLLGVMQFQIRLPGVPKSMTVEIPTAAPVEPIQSSLKKRVLTFQNLVDSLQNTSGTEPLPPRFRSLFALKHIGGIKAIEAIGGAFQDPSVLLKHELAYVLGQMKDIRAIPILNGVLADEEQDPMVRHEAAEALGAIGSKDSLPILQQYKQHPNPAVSETCEIAIDRILRADYKSEVLGPNETQFGSVDPAPSLPEKALSTEELGDMLMNTSLPLYERYRAMFSLRNRGMDDEAAVLALCRGFHDASALFRHEIGYVLGQLQHAAAVPALTEVLKRGPEEHPMVRHEAAEALGSIATDECLEILKAYELDNELVVKESCSVALDMVEYENSDEIVFLPMRDEDDPTQYAE